MGGIGTSIGDLRDTSVRLGYRIITYSTLGGSPGLVTLLSCQWVYSLAKLGGLLKVAYHLTASRLLLSQVFRIGSETGSWGLGRADQLALQLQCMQA